MITDDSETGIARLRELVEAARVIVPFTGAGISTECGIPDFRSPGGLWTRFQPIPFDQFMASESMRTESWRRRFAMEDRFGGARPGRGHRALASLHRAGKVPAVVTQNIDNLHQASGFADDMVVELHGNTTYATCLDCARRYELAWVRERFAAQERAPDCAACGGCIKTATVSFGQAMPEAAMRRAEALRDGLRSVHRHRFVAGGMAGRGISADRQAGRRPAGDSQPRAHRIRRHRGPRHPRGYRADARTVHRRLAD